MFSSVKSLFFIVLITLAGWFPARVMANATAEPQPEEKFDAGHLILHHVQDAHSIHFFDVGHTHITLYLPCIVIGPNGLEIFSSSRFTDEHHLPVPYTTGKGTTFVMADETIKAVNTKGELVSVYDFSITKTVLGMLVALLLVFIIFRSVAKAYTRNENAAPKGLQSFLEPLIIFLRDEVAKPSIGHHYARFMPFLLTVFFFIFISNLLGLIPFIGGFNITGNIAVTMVLALFTFIIMVSRANKGFWMHLVVPPGVPLWLLPLMIPIELIGLLSKPLVLMLRLFANVTAGHIIILAFVCLIFIFGSKFGAVAGYGASPLSLAFSIFMNLLELLVAFLQAYVFTLLSALYFGQATEEAHH